MSGGLTPISGALAFTLLTIGAGWMSLWPIRRRLGRFGYQVAAYPAGLIAWMCVAVITSVVGGVRWQVPIVSIMLLVVSGVAFAMTSAIDRLDHGAGSTPKPIDFVVLAAPFMLVTAVTAATGFSSVGYDSIFHYAAWGAYLADTGTVTVEMAGAYGLLMPSAIAGARMLGVGWLNSVWPLLALVTTALVFMAVRGWAYGLGSKTATAVALGTTALLVTTPPFLSHSIYVHSHMISAAYLALSLYAVQRAFIGIASDDTPSGSISWVFVSGLATAGLATARADGLAYAVVPLLVAAVARLETRRPVASLLGAGASFGAITVLVWGAFYLELGRWQSHKLTGKQTLLVLVALLALFVVTLFIDRVPKLGPWLERRARAMWSVLIAEVAVVGLLLWIGPETFLVSGEHMVRNLSEKGGYGFLWFVLLGMIVASLVWASVWRGGRWPRLLLFGVVQFFVVAFLVHGATHPGRLGPGDSFTRVAFHVVPLLFWYAGLFVTGLVQAYRGSDEDVPDREDPATVGAV